ncbi:MAG: accessory gene regulator B family protein [Hungatella sp.]|jgi:accessory gene regulator B|nr:accessory gene regulator B family protein [Hungatella sp.]
MTKNLVCLLIEYLVNTEAIDRQDKDIYVYGLELLFMNILNLATAIVIGMALGQLFECFLFLALFVPLRSYAGGYHAKNSFYCYLVSCFVMVSALLLVRLSPKVMRYDINLLLMFCSSAVITILAPVENINKPLESDEIQIYGKLARLILAIEVFISIVCHYFSYDKLSWLVTLTLFIVAITVLSGKIQNNYHHRTDET